MKISEFLLLKYAEDTMRVPEFTSSDKAPVEVVEIPSSPRVPSFESGPSYDDLFIERPKSNHPSPEKAVNIIINRCEEFEGFFSKEELATFRKQLQTKGANFAFKSVLLEIQKKAFAAESCLQIAKNYSVYIK